MRYNSMITALNIDNREFNMPLLWICFPELEVFSIFKLHWDIGILGTVQACTVLNIAKLRMLE